MLPGLRYFQSIDCPCEEKCERPYCHFRHPNVLEASTTNISLDTVNKAIKTLKNQIADETLDSTEFYSTCPSASTRNTGSDYVPYHPHDFAADLYEQHNQKNVSSVLHRKESRQEKHTKKRFVLHGAKGSSKSFSKYFRHKKQSSQSLVNYSAKSVRSPVNDLEYDPLCNFSVPDVTCKQTREHKNTVSETPPFLVIDEEDTAEGDSGGNNSFRIVSDGNEEIKIDDANAQLYKNSDTKPDGCSNPANCTKTDVTRLTQTEKEPNQAKFDDIVDTEKIGTRNLASAFSAANTAEITPVISEQNISVTCEGEKQASRPTNIDLFGADSDTENKPEVILVSESDEETKSSNIAKHVEVARSDCDDDVIIIASYGPASGAKKVEPVQPNVSKKRKANASHKDENAKRMKTKEAVQKLLKTTGKKVKRKSSSDEKGATKKSSKLLKRSSVPARVKAPDNIMDFIDKDELKMLDEELNGTNTYDECLKIYKEGLADEMKARKNCKSNKPKGKTTVQSFVENKSDEIRNAEKEQALVPQKHRRVAHQSALTSSSCLIRVPKKAKKILSPAEAMLQRVEILKQEENERQLNAAIAGYEAISTKFSKARTAHLPSADLGSKSTPSDIRHWMATKTSSTSQSKRSPGVKAKVFQPFADLRMSNSETTVQTTATKGCKRIAHTGKAKGGDSVNGIERPKILPDRFSKVPTNIRQRYLTVFIDECLSICGDDKVKAYKMAQAEEMKCKERSNTKTIYLSLAASALKKLRSAKSADSNCQTRQEGEKLRGHETPMKVAFKTNRVRVAKGARADVSIKSTSSTKKRERRCQGGFSVLPKDKASNVSREELYEKLCKYILTEEQLQENGYPRPSAIPGTCIFMVDRPKLNHDSSKKVCARCGKEFVLYKTGHFARKDDECVHHWGRAYFTKVGSTWEKRYTCCQNPVGSEGCSVAETHVHQDNKLDCGGYVQTLAKTPPANSDPGIYSIDCEMAYTVVGLELTRVSVIDFDCNVVYDTFVKPRGRVLDYNTKWSGVTEEDLNGVTTTLRDVQAAFLTKFSSDSILMGHSLESDLMALRLMHSAVIDTSVVFPHRLGPPYKRALRNLMADYLGILIQNADDEGHDSAEDATACIKLMRWKLEEDMKLSK